MLTIFHQVSGNIQGIRYTQGAEFSDSITANFVENIRAFRTLKRIGLNQRSLNKSGRNGFVPVELYTP